MRQLRRLSAVGRVSNFVAIVALSASLASGLAGCGKEESNQNKEKKAKKGESCEVTGDCKKGLLCRKSTCVEESSAVGQSCEGHRDCNPDENIWCSDGTCEFFASPGDAGIDTTIPESDAASAGDTGVQDTSDGGTIEPKEEGYYISYILSNDDEGTARLRAYHTGEENDVPVSPESVACTNNCWLSKDKKHFVYTKDAGAGKVSIYVADVGSNLRAKGAGSPLVEDVEDVSMLENHVTYLKGETNGEPTARVKPVSGGPAETVGLVGRGSDWFVDPEHDVGMIFSEGTSPQSLRVDIGKATDRESDNAYTLGGPNFKDQGGGFFNDDRPYAISPDGGLVAFLTPRAPNDYDRCTRESPNDEWSSKECNGDKYFKCGNESRCTRLEVTARFVDVDKTDNLGEQCSGGVGACGPIHECYVPADDQINKARCIPGRVVLGVPTIKQGPKRETTACEIVQEDDTIDFTGAQGPLTFDAQNNLYLVGRRSRSCLSGDFSVPSSKIVRVDPREETYETLEGLPDDKDFDNLRCWNKQKQELEIDDDCHTYVASARISPGGHEIAFTATNPNTSTPGQARDYVSLWHMLRDGSDRWYTGDKNTPEQDVVTNIRVHSTD